MLSDCQPPVRWERTFGSGFKTDSVNRIVNQDVRPTHRRGCRSSLPAAPGPTDPPPVRFQALDLPDIAAVVTEYRGPARTCPRCGEVTRQAIPPAVRGRAVGSRRTAVRAYRAGCPGISRRGAAAIAAAVFAAPVPLGTVSDLERGVREALAPPTRRP